MRVATNSLSQGVNETDSSFLITGATGFVGAALLLELLRTQPRDMAYCLVRASSGEHAQRRLNSIIGRAAEAYGMSHADAESVRKRAVAIKGDLTEPGLGLTQTGRTMLRDAGPLRVWHCAASLKDTEEALAEIVAHNVVGTERVLETVLQFDVEVFNHISTAYVAGRTTGVAHEVTDRPRGFNNRYEQSKHYGEMAVLDHCKRANVPVRILRPGIVIAHSVTAKATGYTGYLGWILKVAVLKQASGSALENRSLQYVGSPNAILNVIPIDSVVEDCVAIAEQGAATYNHVFNLTNTEAPTVQWLCDVTTDTLGMAPIRMVNKDTELDRLSQKFFHWTRFERPYVAATKHFSRAASNELYDSPRQGRCPITKELLQRMIRHAVADYHKQQASQSSRGAA